MRSVFLLLLGLAACGPGPGTTSGATWRDPTVRLASKADFDAASFAGEWYEVARFPGTMGCRGAQFRYELSSLRKLTRTTRCRNEVDTTAVLAVSPLGRLTYGPTEVPLWVLWTDEGYRTAILVSPDGTGGQILNRSSDLPADRLRAALEVLDFNGFDTTALIFEASS